MRNRDENKETAIREKAMDLIVEEGFDGLSMQKLAKAAGVSPATIYIYYKNREALLNQLYLDVQQKFTEVALEGFHMSLSLEEGLWLQWKNRFRFIQEFPVHFSFHEQFRNSPLVNHNDVQISEFKENMRLFVRTAIKRGEMPPMEPEVFWALAYGPFYSLIRFHLQKKSFIHPSQPFILTEVMMRKAFLRVMLSFKA